MDQDGDRDGELRALRKAKTDLETLIDTSPVGVVVFDVRTPAVSFNQEMRRIVDGCAIGIRRPSNSWRC